MSNPVRMVSGLYQTPETVRGNPLFLSSGLADTPAFIDFFLLDGLRQKRRIDNQRMKR